MSSAAAPVTKPRPDTYNYVVSASRETVIDHCVSGSFTSDQAIDTICSKGSRIEVRTLQEEEEKLVLVCTQLCFGRITCLKLMRSPITATSAGAGKEWLFVVTDRPHFFLFSFDNGKLVERAFGKLGEMLSKPVAVPLVVVDQKSRFVLCHLFNGLLSVICFDGKTGGVRETFITSLEELNVLDLEIVCCSAQRQVLCVLHEDNRENRHVKTYELNPKNLREMLPGPWNQPHVEGTAHRLLAALEGVLVFSSSSVVHLRENVTAAAAAAAAPPTITGNANATKSAALITTIPLFFGRVEAVGYVELDGSRVLVGDELGSLYVLAIAPRTFNMTIEFLGDTSVATRLCYLDSGLVFVASRLGDSQLVRLPDDSAATNTAVEVLETFTNLGPIVSMCLMDLEKKGQLVTCSGGVKDGSLRIVRNGVGVDEQCAIDLPGILGMYGVKQSQQAEYDSFLVQSFSTETRVLGFSRQDNSTDVVLSELSFPAGSKFQCDAPTLFCGNLNDEWMVQVNPNRVRFLKTSALNEDSMEEDEHWDWPIPAGKRVTMASSFQGKNPEQHLVLLGLTGGLLVVVERGGSVAKLEVQMEHEISAACAAGGVICVGLWFDLTLRVLDSETGKQVHSTPAQQEDALATSMVFCRFSTLLHLLVGYGDGRLIIFCLDDATGKFFSKRSIALGSQPVELTAFIDSITGSRYVFAACDRPSIVYCAPHAQDKVLLSNVNAPMSTVTRVAQFNSEQFPNCLALASDESLVIGMVNDVQKLHVKSVPLGERPNRIAHQPTAGAFGVCVHANGDDDDQQQQGFAEQCRLRLIDDRTFKIVDSFRFDETELPFCIISTTFGLGDGDTAKSYFVVGTAYTNDDDPEPSRGRILVFEVSKMEGDSERKLFVVTEKIVKGGVYDMCCLASGKLVAGVNAKIQIFSWTDRPANAAAAAPAVGKNTNQDLLLQDASFHGHTLCLNVRAFGEYIVVGDLVKSVSLLVYDVKKNKVSEVSRALPPSWVTSLAVLEDTSFLISDADGNLVVLRPDGPAATGGENVEESALVTAGDFYWGDFINTFCLGSLTMRTDEAAAPSAGGDALAVRANPKLLFGTASGAIGVLATLTAKEFALLDRLQVAMDEVCIGVGMQRYSEWRAFRAHGKTHPSRGFIDGDLVETLMELDLGELDRVCEKMNQGLTLRDATHTVHTDEPERVTTEDLLRLVEDLMRLH